jgi:hypothetical protein
MRIQSLLDTRLEQRPSCATSRATKFSALFSSLHAGPISETYAINPNLPLNVFELIQWDLHQQENERASGYYSREWQWSKMKQNADWIVQYGSQDDPFIPIDEMHHVAKNIGTEFIGTCGCSEP